MFFLLRYYWLKFVFALLCFVVLCFALLCLVCFVFFCLILLLTFSFCSRFALQWFYQLPTRMLQQHWSKTSTKNNTANVCVTVIAQQTPSICCLSNVEVDIHFSTLQEIALGSPSAKTDTAYKLLQNTRRTHNHFTGFHIWGDNNMYHVQSRTTHARNKLRSNPHRCRSRLSARADSNSDLPR